MFVLSAKGRKKKGAESKRVRKKNTTKIHWNQPASQPASLRCYSGNVNVAGVSALQSRWNTHKHTQIRLSIQRDEHVVNARTHGWGGEKKRKLSKVLRSLESASTVP